MLFSTLQNNISCRCVKVSNPDSYLIAIQHIVLMPVLRILSHISTLICYCSF